jgi:ABC-type glycerol-3-phosphate transport system substrate-binding protein
MIVQSWMARNPGVKVRTLGVDMRTGETITMDALVAAGNAPDLYVDFVGRVSKYLDVDFAQPLYIDESLFVPELLDWGRIDGQLYGIPTPVPGQAMVLNLDILDEVGYVVPDRWTTYDFLEMAEKVKAAGYYATALFAANPSADYLWVNWFASFGAEFWTEDYKSSALHTSAGLAAFRWLEMLNRAGYVPAGPQTITDDDALEIWQAGKVAAMPIRPSWIKGYLEPAVKAGILEKEFRTLMVPFPRDPSVAGVPTIGAGNMIILRKTDDKSRAAALTDLALRLNGHYVQTLGVSGEGFPTLKSVTSVANNPHEMVVRQIAEEFGWMRVGYHKSWYYEIRALLPEILRDMYAGLISAEIARDRFYVESNAILAK